MSIRRGRGSVPKGGCSIKNHPVNTTQPLQKSVGRQVAQFAVPGFIALVALAIVSYVIAQRVAADEALRDATELAEVMARAAVEPELEGADLTRSVGLSGLDRLARQKLLADPVVAIRLWADDGTIVYATEPRLIGQRFELGPDEREILNDGGIAAEVSDLGKPENRYERGFGELVEVYRPVEADGDNRYLFEIYASQSAIDQAAQRIMAAFTPVLVGSLVVLTGILIGLAWRMARRLQQENTVRERLLHHALDSSETERRRIAADLHDGVVQDLAGVTYALAAMADQADDPAARGKLDRTAMTTRSAVRSLRSLLLDIYPQSLSEAGLNAALADLVSGLPPSMRGEVSMPDPVTLDDSQQSAIYRAARESIHNAARHSAATQVQVGVRPRSDGGAVLTVRDDGSGFNPAEVPAGHFGIALLRDLATSVGGNYAIDSSPGRGTLVTFAVPGR